MRYILLQHYNGELSEVAKASVENMQQYAEFCGADYELITGEPVGAIAGLPNKDTTRYPINSSHKVYTLNKRFDDYDVVAMIDPDMFVRKGMSRNLFTDETGVGICSDRIRQFAKERFSRSYPQYSSKDCVYWGGAIYRLDLSMRKKLRKQWDIQEVQDIGGNTRFGDEGIMHNLARKANIPDEEQYILDQKWCWCSYLPKLNEAYIIHIRKKVDPTGRLPRVSKEETLQKLKDEDII